MTQHDAVALIQPVIDKLEKAYEGTPMLELRLTIGLLSSICASIYAGSKVLEEHAELTRLYVRSLKRRMDLGELK